MTGGLAVLCRHCGREVRHDPYVGRWVHAWTSGLMCEPQSGACTQPALYATPEEGTDA